MKKAFYIIFIISINYQFLLAQEKVKYEGEIESAQILIEKNKIILLPDVKKIGNDSIEKTKELLNQKVKFNLMTVNSKPEKLISNQYKNVLIEKKNIDKNHNSILFQYGNYRSFTLKSYHRIDVLEDVRLNASIDHNSNKFGAFNDEISGFYNSKIFINSDYTYNNIYAELNLDYKRIKSFYYGILNNDFSVYKNDIAFTNNFFNYNILLKKDVYDKFYYDISFNNTNFQEKYTYAEYVSTIEGNIQYDLSNKLKSNLKTINYYRHLKKVNRQMFPSSIPIIKNNLFFIYTLGYELNNYNINVGLLYNLDTKNGESEIYPNVNLNYNNPKGYYFEFFLNGGDDTNFYYKKLEENPFFYDLDFEYIDLVEKISYGINFGAKFLNKKGNIKLNYSDTKISNFFAYGKSSYDKIISYYDKNVIYDVYRYTLHYDSGNVNHRKIELYFDYEKNKFINSSMIFIYNNYSLNNFSHASNKPKFEIYYSNVTTVNKFIITVKLLSYIDTYSVDLNNKSEKLENYFSIDFDINYSIFKNSNIIISINNILDSKNEIYYKYQDLGFNAKIGFIYNFR